MWGWPTYDQASLLPPPCPSRSSHTGLLLPFPEKTKWELVKTVPIGLEHVSAQNFVWILSDHLGCSWNVTFSEAFPDQPTVPFHPVAVFHFLHSVGYLKACYLLAYGFMVSGLSPTPTYHTARYVSSEWKFAHSPVQYLEYLVSRITFGMG